MNSSQKKGKKKIGIISDTHGLLRSSVTGIFSNVEMIVHAGDIGSREVLEKLSALAPVVAVRGNMDGGTWSHGLPLTDTVEIGKELLHVLHDVSRLDINPSAAGIRVLVHGHTHRPSIEKRDDVLFINPGSAGPVRHSLPPTVALITIDDNFLDAEIITLSE